MQRASPIEDWKLSIMVLKYLSWVNLAFFYRFFSMLFFVSIQQRYLMIQNFSCKSLYQRSNYIKYCNTMWHCLCHNRRYELIISHEPRIFGLSQKRIFLLERFLCVIARLRQHKLGRKPFVQKFNSIPISCEWQFYPNTLCFFTNSTV